MIDGPDAAAAPTNDPRPAWPQFAVVNRSTLPEEIAARLLDLIKAESSGPATSSRPSASWRP